MGEAKRRAAIIKGKIAQNDAIVRQAYEQTCLSIEKSDGNPINALMSSYTGRDFAMDMSASRLDQSAIDCSSGCSACCHQMVLCSPFEVIMIAKMILDTWPVDKLDKLDDRFDVLGEMPLNAEARFGFHAPCPLLDGKDCSVYKQRPLACRALYSNSRKRCESSLQAGGGDVSFLADPQMISSALTAGINAALKQKMNLNIEMVELSGALYQALLEFDIVAMSWLSGGDPFQKHQVTSSSNRTMSEMADIVIDRMHL